MYRTVKNGRHSCWNGSTRIRENLPSKIIEWVEKGSLSRNTDRNLTPTKKKKKPNQSQKINPKTNNISESSQFE